MGRIHNYVNTQIELKKFGSSAPQFHYQMKFQTEIERQSQELAYGSYFRWKQLSVAGFAIKNFLDGSGGNYILKFRIHHICLQMPFKIVCWNFKISLQSEWWNCIHSIDWKTSMHLTFCPISLKESCSRTTFNESTETILCLCISLPLKWQLYGLGTDLLWQFGYW